MKKNVGAIKDQGTAFCLWLSTHFVNISTNLTSIPPSKETSLYQTPAVLSK